MAELLQQHDYLDLLKGGLDGHQVSAAQTMHALALAQEVWHPLQLMPSQDSQMVTSAWRCREQGQLLVHIPTATADCFLIVVFDQAGSMPSAYILFDVGAEYRVPRIACPAFGLDGTASQRDIAAAIPQLAGMADPFAVIELRGGTYMQVYADELGFHLEHQLVSPGSHYHCVEVVDADVAVQTLTSYAFGKYEWAYERRWERMDL